MTETKCFRDAFRDQFHELSGQPNTIIGWRSIAFKSLLIRQHTREVGRKKAVANNDVVNIVPRYINPSNSIKSSSHDLIYSVDRGALSNDAFHEHLTILALKGIHDTVIKRLYNTRRIGP